MGQVKKERMSERYETEPKISDACGNGSNLLTDGILSDADAEDGADVIFLVRVLEFDDEFL